MQKLTYLISILGFSSVSSADCASWKLGAVNFSTNEIKTYVYFHTFETIKNKKIEEVIPTEAIPNVSCKISFMGFGEKSALSPRGKTTTAAVTCQTNGQSGEVISSSSASCDGGYSQTGELNIVVKSDGYTKGYTFTFRSEQ